MQNSIIHPQLYDERRYAFVKAVFKGLHRAYQEKAPLEKSSIEVSVYPVCLLLLNLVLHLRWGVERPAAE